MVLWDQVGPGGGAGLREIARGRGDRGRTAGRRPLKSEPGLSNSVLFLPARDTDSRTNHSPDQLGLRLDSLRCLMGAFAPNLYIHLFHNAALFPLCCMIIGDYRLFRPMGTDSSNALECLK